MYSSKSGRWPGSSQPCGRAHVGDAHALLAGVHAADVLVDQLGLGARGLDARGDSGSVRHRCRVYQGCTHRDELMPILRGVSHFWAFWCALAATVLARRVRTEPGPARARGAGLRRRHVRAVRRQRAVPPPALRPAAALAAVPDRPQRDLRLHRRQLHAGGAARARRLGALDAVRRRRGPARSAASRSASAVDDGAAGAVRGHLRRARLGRDARDPGAGRALDVTPLLLFVAGGAALLGRRGRLRHAPAGPVAAHVRLPRGLPRAGHRRRRRCTSWRWPAG